MACAPMLHNTCIVDYPCICLSIQTRHASMHQLFKDPNEPPSSFSNLCRAVTPVSSESLCMRLRGESQIVHPLSKRAKSSEVPLEPYAVHPVTIPSFGLPFLEFSPEIILFFAHICNPFAQRCLSGGGMPPCLCSGPATLSCRSTSTQQCRVSTSG